MIWDTSIWRLECSNRSKIPSAQKCYLCLRYVVSPMSPGRTPQVVGGREGIRTPDPLLAKQVLSQLSYTPIVSVILLSSIPVAGVFRTTMNSPFLGTFGTTSFGKTKP